MSVRRLDVNGDVVFGRLTSIIPTGSEATSAILLQNLRLYLGEWFLDSLVGVAAFDLDNDPTSERILGGKTDPILLEAEIKRVVLETDGVSELLSFSLTVDNETRRAVVSLTYRDIFGEAIPFNTVFPP
jgi:hypothetical protein